MRRIILLCVAAVCVLGCFGLDKTSDELIKSARMIPVVNYTPSRFRQVVSSSFNFNSNTQCYFLDRNKDNTFDLYWHNNLCPSDTPKLNKINSKVQLSDKQRDILKDCDSVFIFNPLPYSPYLIPQDIRYICYIDNGNICYASKDKTFIRLTDFLTYEFGSTSNFRQKYLKKINDLFLSSWSGIYCFDNDTDAMDFLKRNYKFMAISGLDFDDVLSSYIGLLKMSISISPEKESRLADMLRATYDNPQSLISDFLAGRDLDVFNKRYLRSMFSLEEYNLINNVMSEEDAKLAAAYRRLSSHSPNIDENGAYTTDIDRLKIIANKVFK